MNLTLAEKRLADIALAVDGLLEDVQTALGELEGEGWRATWAAVQADVAQGEKDCGPASMRKPDPLTWVWEHEDGSVTAWQRHPTEPLWRDVAGRIAAEMEAKGDFVATCNEVPDPRLVEVAAIEVNPIPRPRAVGGVGRERMRRAAELHPHLPPRELRKVAETLGGAA